MQRRSAKEEAQYDLENSIGYLLNRAAHLIAARFSDDLKPNDVSLQVWRILATLSHSGNQSMSELADHTGAELSYLSRCVASVEERGLVDRKQSPLDKRASLLSLTKEGRALVRQLAPKGRAIEKASLLGVPTADLEATLRTLRTVCRNLVESPDASEVDGINRKLTVARRVTKRMRASSAHSTIPEST